MSRTATPTTFDPHARLQSLLDKAHGLAAVRCAVVHPCDAPSLSGAIAAAAQGLIVPVLIGPRSRIEAAAEQAGVDIAAFELLDCPHSHAAADAAADLAERGQVEVLMKGSLHTDELLHAVLARPGLRTARRMSQASTSSLWDRTSDTFARFGINGQRIVIAIPLLWMLLFFLIPFLIVFKISLATKVIGIPPFTSLLDWSAGGALPSTMAAARRERAGDDWMP